MKIIKNIFLFLILLFFSTNLYAQDCSSLYSSLGRPNKVSLLWIDDTSNKTGAYALINKIKGDTFYLCKKTRTNYSINDNNLDSLKDLDLDQTFYNAEDSFKVVFKITSEETTEYILSKLYLPDFGISKSNLVTAFALSKKEEQASKYITKKPSKEIEEAIEKKEVKKKKPKKEEQKKIVKKPETKKQKKIKVEVKELDKTPPELRIKETFVFKTQKFTIKGKVSDKRAEEVYIFVDDEQIPVESNGTFEFTKFTPKKNITYKVKAMDSNGNDLEKTIRVEIKGTIIVKKIPKLDPTKIRNVNRGDVVALIIGIENYQEAPKTIYAKNDAEYFAEYARLAFGASRDNIKILTDKDATRNKILKTLKNWMPTRITKNETEVIVFFAGHGLPSQDGKKLYLLPQNGDQSILEDSAISKSDLFSMINQHNPKSVKVFIDACYSGESRQGEQLIASRGIKVTASNDIPDNFTVFSASQSNEVSLSFDGAKHGIFSYYLMRGLEGEADKNKNREITNGELLAYIEKEVNARAVELGRTQVPSLVGKKNNTLNRY